MNGYYRPQEILVMEAELARAKAMLATQGVAAELLEFNTPLLAELVIKARSQVNATSQPGRDVASMVASQFKRTMLGLEAAEKVSSPSGDLSAAQVLGS
jgi:hypothetical protein